MATPMQQVDILRADVDRLMNQVEDNEQRRVRELSELETKAKNEIDALKQENYTLRQAQAGSGIGRKRYDEKVTTKNFVPTVFDNDRKKVAG